MTDPITVGKCDFCHKIKELTDSGVCEECFQYLFRCDDCDELIYLDYIDPYLVRRGYRIETKHLCGECLENYKICPKCGAYVYHENFEGKKCFYCASREAL